MDNKFIMKNFMAGFIKRAVKDWVNYPTRRNEIRKFFKSTWGEMCCCAINFKANYLLRLLEQGKINLEALEREIA